ncbi:MAG TPA: ECF transporter S component [Desulfotomaculum sp.]|nr:ECF transporter S component [Desulfotomaculum sp.]
MRYLYLSIVFCLGIFIFSVPFWGKGSILDPNTGVLNWGLVATVFVSLAVLGFFQGFESTAKGAKEIALISMLGTVSALSRLPFAAMMGFQPCGLFIICTGYVFGPLAGFMTACLTILISNIFLGHGPWTPYQMFSWGLVGVTAAWLKKFPFRRERYVALVLFGVIWGYLYGAIMNVWFWTYFVYPLTLKTYLFTEFNAAVWDSSRALANGVFLGFFGAKVIRVLERFKKRFYWNTNTSGNGYD